MMVLRSIFFVLTLSMFLSPIGEEIQASSVVSNREHFAPQPTPKRAVERHLDLLRERIKDPSLTLYTRDSRKFFSLHLMTDEQQRREWTTVVDAMVRAEEIIGAELAVVRFPVDRHIPPYLLRHSARGWMLDIAAMSRIIGFDTANRWFFRQQNHPWMFAFSDWHFDRNGFRQ